MTSYRSPIRVVAWTAAVVLALTLAPAALASAPPPTRSSSGVLIVTRLQLVFRLGPTQRKDRVHSCAWGARRSKLRLPGSGAMTDLARKAVVACEQPPRSVPLTLGDLKHAAAVAAALTG